MSRRKTTWVVAAAALILGGVTAYGYGWAVLAIGLVLAALGLLPAGSRYGEWVLAAFLLAGTYKIAFNLPVDITVALGIALIGVSLARVVRDGMPVSRPALLWLFPAIALLLIVGAWMPPAAEYGVTKAVRFATLGLLTVGSTWLIVRDESSVRSFIRALTVVSGAICVGSLLSGGLALSPVGRLTFFGSNTIALGRAGFLGALGSSAEMLWNKKATFWALVLATASVLAMLGSGSRGPVVAFVLALGVMYAVRLRSAGTKRSALALGVAGVIVASTSLWSAIPEASLARYSALLSGSVDSNIVDRASLFQKALSIFLAHPFAGLGTGSFAESSFLQYPHNLLLELASENGLIAPLLMLALIAGAILMATKRALQDGRLYGDYLTAALVGSTFNALVSGDINSNRLLYSFIAVSVSLAATQAAVQSSVHGEGG